MPHVTLFAREVSLLNGIKRRMVLFFIHQVKKLNR
jgi:hypothetical protein